MVDNRIGRAYIEIDADADDIDDELDDAARDRNTTIDVDTETDLANKRLNHLARTREALIIPIVNSAAMRAANATLARLSGGRLLKNYAQNLWDIGKNIDTLAPKIGGMTSGLFAAGGAALALVSNLAGIGSGLSSIVASSVALPGIFMGMGAGLAVGIMAFKDAKTVLADLGDDFSALQDSVSAKFWAEAEQPIRRLAGTYLPLLSDGLGTVATEMGVFVTGIADALSGDAGTGLMREILADTAEGLRVATEGTQNWTEGLLGLGSVGSAYLPRLMEWMNDLGESFSNWVDVNKANGNFTTWIENGITQMGFLSDILSSTWGVFSALGQAAREAGVNGLGPLASGMQSLSRAMNSAEGMANLITLFKAVHATMAAMKPGIDALADSFVALLPTLSTALPTAGSAVGKVFETLANILSNPVFQSGLVTLLEGFNKAVDILGNASGPLGDIFGTLLGTMGELLPPLFTVLTQGLSILAPIVEAVAAAIVPLAQVLSGALTAAMTALGPIIVAFVDSLSRMIQANPQAAAGILGLVAGAVGLAGAFSKLIGPLLKVIGPFQRLWPLIAGHPLLMLAGVVVGLVAAFVSAGGTGESFAAMIASMGEKVTAFAEALPGMVTQLLGMVAQVLPGIMQALTSALGTIAQVIPQILPPILEAIIMLVQAIASLLPTLLPVLLEAATTLFLGLVQVVGVILPVLIEAVLGLLMAVVSIIPTVIPVLIEGAITLFMALVEALPLVLPPLIEAVTGTIEAVAEFLPELIGALLEAAVTLFTALVDALPEILPPLIDGALDVIMAVVDLLPTLIPTLLDAGIALFMAIVEAMPEILPQLLQAALEVITAVIELLPTLIGTLLEAAVQLFMAIVEAVPQILGDLLSAIGELISSAVEAVKDYGPKFLSAGEDLIMGMVEGVKDGVGSLVSAVTDAASRALEAAKDFLGIDSPSKLFRYEVGQPIGQGTQLGVKDEERDLIKATRNLMMNSIPKVPGTDARFWGPPFEQTRRRVPAAQQDGGGFPSHAEVAKAVAQALDGATLTLTGVDYLANSTAARINTAIARGV